MSPTHKETNPDSVWSSILSSKKVLKDSSLKEQVLLPVKYKINLSMLIKSLSKAKTHKKVVKTPKDHLLKIFKLLMTVPK